ncbi:MAG: lysophospholipid acyltransferase family protein [Alphaproteobacteria bacterium]|nr:lysophospholipid acyltransferase family protein [Alphaproteobacteria bacterium]
MQLRKRLLSFDFVQRLLGALIALYVFLVYRTSRWSVEGREHPQPFWDSEKNFIVCFWHGRMLMLPYAWEGKRPFTQLNSGHRDGIVSVRAQEHFGVKTVIGSATVGAMTAFRGLLKTVHAGETIGVTPDGPHGPRMRAKPGIVTIASKTGVPILPLAFSAGRCKVLSSWDRFVLCYPFTRGHFVWGEPIYVPKDLDEKALETIRQLVEDRLYALTVEADARYGHPTIVKAGVDEGKKQRAVPPAREAGL